MSEHAPDQYAELIESLYDAAGEQRLWCGMAARIAVAFDSTSVVLKMHGMQGSVQLIETTDNFSVASQDQALAEYWHRNDLWVERAKGVGLSKIVTSQSLMPDREFEKSAFYQDWCRKLEIFHMVGAIFPVSAESLGVFGIHRPRQGRAYDENECRRFAEFLGHLQRVFRLHGRLSGLAQTRTAAFAALDSTGIGHALVDRKGRLTDASPLCESILRSLEAAKAVKVINGVITSGDPVIADRLRQLIHAAGQPAAGKVARPEATLVIARPQRLPISIALVPLPPAWHTDVSHQPCAIMFLCDPERPVLWPACLQDQYGLTPTEAAVAVELAKGKSLQRIALCFGIGLGTVRSHLKKILSKTGTSRQAELVVLILRNAAGFVPAAPKR